MANGVKIISEDDFANTDPDTSRRWTHRMLTEIYDQNKHGEDIHIQIIDKLDASIRSHQDCPGRNYPKGIDRVLVATMGLLGGMIAVFIALKTKILALAVNTQ